MGRVRSNVILYNFFTFKTNTFSIINSAFLFRFLLPHPFSVLLFWYSSICFLFDCSSKKTFQNANKTYTYKNTSLKQILFLSSSCNTFLFRIYSSTHNTTKTRQNRLKIPQNQYFSALFRTSPK